MKFKGVLCRGAIAAMFAGVRVFAAGIPGSSAPATSPPVFVPDLSQANGPLPDGVLAWSSLFQNTNAAADQQSAHFVFSFTNIATVVDRTLTTNVTTLDHIAAVTNRSFWSFWRKRVSYVTNFTSLTNLVWITNSVTPIPVTILDAHASCGCTQPELPRKPWTIPPGASGTFGVSVDLTGKSGILLKTVTISTDKGSKDFLLRISILPPVIPTLTDAERTRGLEMAKADRQAVFRGDCATCHVKNGEGKYGKALYDAVCAICHEAEHRATMVPDLHDLKVPTNDEFWRTWIAHGKPGSLMPAFSSAEGGPFNDMQIASLAAYLNYAIPSHVFPPPTNAAPAN